MRRALHRRAPRSKKKQKKASVFPNLEDMDFEQSGLYKVYEDNEQPHFSSNYPPPIYAGISKIHPPTEGPRGDVQHLWRQIVWPSLWCPHMRGIWMDHEARKENAYPLGDRVQKPVPVVVKPAAPSMVQPIAQPTTPTVRALLKIRSALQLRVPDTSSSSSYSGPLVPAVSPLVSNRTSLSPRVLLVPPRPGSVLIVPKLAVTKPRILKRRGHPPKVVKILIDMMPMPPRQNKKVTPAAIQKSSSAGSIESEAAKTKTIEKKVANLVEISNCIRAAINICTTLSFLLIFIILLRPYLAPRDSLFFLHLPKLLLCICKTQCKIPMFIQCYSFMEKNRIFNLNKSLFYFIGRDVTVLRITNSKAIAAPQSATSFIPTMFGLIVRSQTTGKCILRISKIWNTKYLSRESVFTLVSATVPSSQSQIPSGFYNIVDRKTEGMFVFAGLFMIIDC
ncbi:hypothetical protein CAEBREN_10685 [Caenorhabditis brenneri]|uniref:Uncharacterized protein n=1 Tax=Caenorhabditis brenneri TaxID=135651 RepID=G0NSU2_CAEBE|nr:hypothetical protein CAEBREN_10685 [Caenorhabditis brenneri]